MGSFSPTCRQLVGNTRLELVTSSMSRSDRAFIATAVLKKLNDLCVLYFVYFIVCRDFQKNDTKVTRNLDFSLFDNVSSSLLDRSKENKNGISKSIATNALYKRWQSYFLESNIC